MDDISFGVKYGIFGYMALVFYKERIKQGGTDDYCALWRFDIVAICGAATQ